MFGRRKKDDGGERQGRAAKAKQRAGGKGPRFVIDQKACYGCALCAAACPQGCIIVSAKFFIEQKSCTRCGKCVPACPYGCIHVER